MDTLSMLVSQNPVVIFGYSYCGISHSITSLIRGFGANTIIYELDEIANGKQIERALVQMTSRQGSAAKTSVPAVFIGQKFVGGSNEVMSLHLRNELVPLLRRANALWV